MPNKIVSIIIPTYNYGHLVAESLNCLIAQTYQHWEAIIIDDGSTDNTEKRIKPFLESDNRIIYIKQNNKGVSAARNIGLKIAKGEYIQFLDADDLLSSDKLALQVDFLENNSNIDVCVVKALFFENQNKSDLYTDLCLLNKTVMPKVNGAGYAIISDFIQNNLTVIESPLFKKSHLETIGFFREDMHYLEDWDFWMRFAINNLEFGFLDCDETMVLVRSHKLSATKISNKIRVAEGKLRNLFNGYIKLSALSYSQKKELTAKNDKLLISTFKLLMAETSYLEIDKFVMYYKEMKNSSKFLKALIKSINLKRKIARS